VYSVEKNVKEFGDKIDPSEKTKIEEAAQKLRKAMEGEDLAALRAAQEELTTASHKLAEAMYAKSAGQGQAGPQAGPGAGPGTGAQASAKKDEDVVDADFEDVK
jgi:molecular chaperone DnaK